LQQPATEEEEEDAPKPRYYWNGIVYESLLERLVDILEDEDDEAGSEHVAKGEEGAKLWTAFRKVLRAFLRLPVGQTMHATEIYSQTYDGQEEEDGKFAMVGAAIRILQGLKLVERLGPVYLYKGPNAFDAWESKHLEKHGDMARACRVKVERHNVPSHMFPRQARKRIKKMRGKGYSSRRTHQNQLHRRMEKVRVKMDKWGLKMTPEQEVSLHHLASGTICNCGRKETKEWKGKMITVHVGFHKRHRCKKCPACKDKICGKCKNCLNPANKQSCVNKVCMFPKTPKCPCFE
jgi:hypothetical protein